MNNESTASSVAQNFNAGDKLAGCYVLKQILPFEGPGVVWLAHDEELDKDLTLHFLPNTVVADSRAMSEIKQEVKRNRQIVQPNILRVHDLIEENNWAAITMDHVEGKTLAALKKAKEKGAFDVFEISPWIPQFCQTLEDAHKVDLLHRDLAPENLLVTKSGGLTVMNFGISRAILDSLSRSGQKVHGDGNLAYMSPQQLDGERVSKWDDIYSLGAVLYDLLTSKPPFFNGELISQIRKSVPPPMSQRRQELGVSGEPVPKSWDKVISECLEKATPQRPKNTLEISARLGADKPTAAPMQTEANTDPEPVLTVKESVEEVKSGVPDPAPAKKSWGPSKTPVITEATVVSQTSVPKKTDVEEGKTTEPARGVVAKEEAMGGERRAGPTTPSGFPLRAFVGVDEGAQSRNKSKVPMSALAIAAVVVVLGAIAYFMTGSDKTR